MSLPVAPVPPGTPVSPVPTGTAPPSLRVAPVPTGMINPDPLAPGTSEQASDVKLSLEQASDTTPELETVDTTQLSKLIKLLISATQSQPATQVTQPDTDPSMVSISGKGAISNQDFTKHDPVSKTKPGLVTAETFQLSALITQLMSAQQINQPASQVKRHRTMHLMSAQQINQPASQVKRHRAMHLMSAKQINQPASQVKRHRAIEFEICQADQ